MSQDLSQAFGLPAASLRGLLPPRAPEPRRPPDDESPSDAASPEPEEEVGFDEDLGFDEDEPEDDGPEEPVAGRRREERPTTAAARRPTARVSRGSSSGTNRRWGRARVASRDHADLLVLLSLRAGPADGRDVITRLRESSGGHLDAPERTIYVTLHRLTRNRLVGRLLDPASGRRLYALTKAGERAAGARLREWQALAHCVDAVARAGGDTDSR